MRRDRFGLRLGEPYPASLIADSAARLRDCANGPETAAARAVVEDALGSKWWGLRVLAIRAIGRWATERDRAWLVERARRLASHDGSPWRTMETREARRVLFARAPRPEDSVWLLDLWFQEPGWGMRPGWLLAVSEAHLRERIAAEIKDGDPERLGRAIRLLFHVDRVGNRVEILRHLASGSNAEAGRLAADLLDRLELPRPPPVVALPRPLRSPSPRRRPPPR